MIVIDTSALIAVLEKEPEHVAFATAMQESQRCYVSALTVYEASVVMLRKRGAFGTAALHRLLASIDAEIVPFDETQVEQSTAAYAQFGKGENRAALNICDCAAYALAASRSMPLLFKGDDFAATDVRSVL